MPQTKLLRITTVPISLQLLLTGQFRYMIDNGYQVYTVSAYGPEVVDVLKEGVSHMPVPFTRKITPLRDILCLFQLVRIIKEIRPDIIHTHTPKAGLLGMLAGWLCRVPVRMHTVAGLPLMETTGMKRRILEAAEWITCNCAQRIYPNSTGLEKFLIRELKVDPGKVKMIGKGSSNGIDTSFFSVTPALEQQARLLRQQHNITAEDLVFSFVGRVVKDKGIVELVTAFKAASDHVIKGGARDKDVRRIFLMIVGPFEQDLDPLPEGVVKFLKEDKRVILAGFQRDVRPWLMASDVFVFPSHREGFPNVVMQACLLQVPCIVSDINGCNEIISHDATGLIVPVKNIAALTQAMLRLFEDERLRKSLSVAARDFVSAHYDREYIWEEIRKEYVNLRMHFTAKARRFAK